MWGLRGLESNFDKYIIEIIIIIDITWKYKYNKLIYYNSKMIP